VLYKDYLFFMCFVFLLFDFASEELFLEFDKGRDPAGDHIPVTPLGLYYLTLELSALAPGSYSTSFTLIKASRSYLTFLLIYYFTC